MITLHDVNRIDDAYTVAKTTEWILFENEHQNTNRIYVATTIDEKPWIAFVFEPRQVKKNGKKNEVECICLMFTMIKSYDTGGNIERDRENKSVRLNARGEKEGKK